MRKHYKDFVPIGEELLYNDEKLEFAFKADFALRAIGDSMISAGINDGDIVFLQEACEVEHNEIACVVIDDEAILRYFYFDKVNECVILIPANPNFDIMTIPAKDGTDVCIIGKVVAIQRSLQEIVDG